MQAFVVGRDGNVFARCQDAKAYNASGLAGWLQEQIRAYDKKYPRLSVSFEEPEGLERDGQIMVWVRDDVPTLLFVARDETRKDDRKAKKQVKATRKFEKAAFKHKDLKAAAKGWKLVRINVAQEDHALLALGHGVKEAPALLMFPAGANVPKNLGKIKAASLIYYLKKNAPK